MKLIDIVLVMVPIWGLLSAVYIYRLNGRRDFLRMDMVQFFYGFVLFPILYIWLKTLLFTVARKELGNTLSQGELFTIDTIFSVVFLYIYSFAVIHSLTATFKLKKVKDPLYDLFLHSEYFHLWLSHLVIYIGGAVLMCVFSLINLLVPFTSILPQPLFWMGIGVSIILGLFGYIGIWMSNPHQGNFMRIMKLWMAAGVLFHIFLYFVRNPDFNSRFALYWFSSAFFSTLAVSGALIERSRRAVRFFDSFKYKTGWDFRVDLFDDKSLEKAEHAVVEEEP
ncbi:MAG TPA: hypothetical protein VD999_03230 [Vitreimonas sp.]|nr:hypothetical protein [Vitreimonas sp.]